MNTNVKCLLSLIFGAGLGYYAARTVLERNYTVSVANAFHDGRSYNGPGYKKHVTITVAGEVVEMAVYPALVDEETGKPYSSDVLADEETVEQAVEFTPAERETAISELTTVNTPLARAFRDYQGLDRNPEAQVKHVREEFMGELQRKLEGVPEDDPEEEVYGQSPLSGGSGVRPHREPFRIPESEYLEGADGYQSLMVIYYEGDQVLVDHLGKPFGRIAAMEAVGDASQLQFGVESSDGNICYVRCEQLKTDFEVIRSEGNFSDVPPSGGTG